MRDRRGFRVAAHVDGVNGFTNCRLSITPAAVSIRLDGWLVRLVRSRAAGRTLVHAGRDVTLGRVRWEVPWRRAALLLFDDEHQVVVSLTRRRAAVVTDALRAGGHSVRELALSYFTAAGPLVAMQQHRHRIRRRGESA